MSTDQTAELPTTSPPRRRVKGLQIKTLPTAANAAQWIGGGAALVGVFLAWGWAVTLIVGGAAVVVLGALKEGGKL